MKIGILECGRTPEKVQKDHGSLPDMFQGLLSAGEFSFASYHVENMAFPEGIRTCDGWLLTGSKHGAYEDHPFIPPLVQFIQDAYQAYIPMVGICFGHQVIAQALGGHVEKFEGGWAVGLNEYQFDGLGAVKLNAWHQDQVTKRPEDAKAVASNSFCENAALIYGDRAFSVQAHPEFSGRFIADYVAMRQGTSDFPDDRMSRAASLTGEDTDSDLIARQIIDFFKQPRMNPNV